MSFRDGSASLRRVSDPLNRRGDWYTHTARIYTRGRKYLRSAFAKLLYRRGSFCPLPNEESVCLHRVITGIPHLASPADRSIGTGNRCEATRSSAVSDEFRVGMWKKGIVNRLLLMSLAPLKPPMSCRRAAQRLFNFCIK